MNNPLSDSNLPVLLCRHLLDGEAVDYVWFGGEEDSTSLEFWCEACARGIREEKFPADSDLRWITEDELGERVKLRHNRTAEFFELAEDDPTL